MSTCAYHEQGRRVCTRAALAWCCLEMGPGLRLGIDWRVKTGMLRDTLRSGHHVVYTPEFCQDHAALVCVQRNASTAIAVDVRAPGEKTAPPR